MLNMNYATFKPAKGFSVAAKTISSIKLLAEYNTEMHALFYSFGNHR